MSEVRDISCCEHAACVCTASLLHLLSDEEVCALLLLPDALLLFVLGAAAEDEEEEEDEGRGRLTGLGSTGTEEGTRW